MTAEQQELWLRAAIDALQDIRAHEVRTIILELQRSVQRPNQIVPEIARLVSERRSRANRSAEPSPYAAELEISREAHIRRAKARSQDEIEAAWQWERDARKAAGLHVHPIEPPLTRREISAMSSEMVKMGLKCGALIERDGQIVNAT
jgi:hypothetical protein